MLDCLLLRDENILWAEGEVRLLSNGGALFENAAPCGSPPTISVCLPWCLGATSLYCIFVTDDGEVARCRMRYRGLHFGMDLYECPCPHLPAGLYWYSFLVEGALGRYYGMRAAGAKKISFSRIECGAHFQLTLTDWTTPMPKEFLGGVIYHIFVDRFFRVGNPEVKPGAILRTDWEDGIPTYPSVSGGHLENNDFFGGTLDGITEKLGFLQTLGVNCLYLSPVFEAYSNHKYDTGDYRRVDAMFGGDEALLRLLDAAARRKMRVILDGVFNHTGSQSLYFNKKGDYPSIGAYQSKESPYYEWYSFSSHPDNYESWWGIDTLPRLTHTSPSLHEFFLGEDGIVAHYASLGIGGFRLDVADELTDEFIAEVKACLSSRLPTAVLYGEVWEDASHKVSYGKRRKYYLGHELDGVMNYPLRQGLIAFFRHGDTAPLSYALTEVLPNMPPRAAHLAMNLLGTHDTERILTALVAEEAGGRSPKELAEYRLPPREYKRGRSLTALAYLVLATLPGIPAIFYGDEVGMQGYRDPLNRGPYPWHRQDRVLLSAFRRIGNMRRRETVFREGGFRLLLLRPTVLAFCRFQGKRRILVVANRGEGAVLLRFDRPTVCLYGDGRIAERYSIPSLDGAVYLSTQGTVLRICLDTGEEIFFDE